MKKHLRNFGPNTLLTLLVWLLLALTCRLDAQTPATIAITPKFSVSNKIATTSSPQTMRKAVLNGKRLYGVNVTDGACAPKDPVAAAKLLSSYGVNWVRLHHIDRGLAEGWWRVDQILAFMDALFAAGIRVSVDGCSKIGETYPGGNDAFKGDLYKNVDAAVSLYKQNVERIKPILQHKACFMLCMVNEGAHMTTPDLAKAFWNRWSVVFRGINPDLLLTDLPDAPASDQYFWQYADVIKGFDVFAGHYYNSDGNADGQGNNIFDGWTWWRILSMADATRKPVFIEEFGSYQSNPFQGGNLAFVHFEAARRNFSTCEFSFASNEEGWAGGGGDRFTICNDPLRRSLFLMGAYVYKNAKAPFVVSWPADTFGNWGTNYSFQGGTVTASEQYCRAGSYIWTWDKARPWVWLVKAF